MIGIQSPFRVTANTMPLQVTQALPVSHTKCGDTSLDSEQQAAPVPKDEVACTQCTWRLAARLAGMVGGSKSVDAACVERRSLDRTMADAIGRPVQNEDGRNDRNDLIKSVPWAVTPQAQQG